MTDLFVRVRQYIDDDVEPTDLPAVLAAAERGEAAAREDLAERFKGPLQFGTAGLRGLMGGGPFRMNRATVLRATDGLVRYLINTIADARERGLVVGRDARHHSDDFQADVAGVAAAHGMRVYWLEGPTPTPLTAFGVLKLNAAAGVVVTASHNPPAYNGYKVFWGNGAQIIPPHDEGIAAAIDAAPGARHVPRDEPVVGEGRIEDVSSLADDYVEALDAVHFAPAVDVGALKVAYTAMHGVGAALFRRVLARRGPVKLFEVAEQIE
ncbi:MAG: phospho-sugar mutase, partial [Myxococcota bacterium]